MLLSSSLDIGVIGDMDQCNKIENASYMGLDVYPNKLPINLMLGLCLPKACTVQILNRVAGKLNPLILKAV